MRHQHSIIPLLILALVFAGFKKSTSKQSVKSINNFHQVNPDLYRSGQPNKKGMKELESFGIITVINLRNSKNDKAEVKNTKLILKPVPVNAWKMSYKDLVSALKTIQQAQKPVLVHCLHGADRTGVTIAAYRMVYEDWPKEKAIAEFLEEQYGFHQKWFPKILELLQNLDVEKLKRDLFVL